jgi:DNA adenine methylase
MERRSSTRRSLRKGHRLERREELRPRIVDRENLLAVATALRGVAIEAADFEAMTESAGREELIYLDPPYHPLSETSAFTSYTADGFGKDDQRRLARVFEELTRRGAFVILSNSSADFVRELYESLDPRPRIDEVSMPRAIRSKVDALFYPAIARAERH